MPVISTPALLDYKGDSLRYDYGLRGVVKLAYYDPGTIIGNAGLPPTAPSIVNVVPTVGTALTATTTIAFDALITGVRDVLILASFPGLSLYEVIHDGTAFGPMYANSINVRTVISGGYHYELLRNGGWPASPTLIPHVIDTFGQENP